MKKILSVLVMILLASASMAQVSSVRSPEEGPITPVMLDEEFVCPSGAVFSQVFGSYDNGYFSQAGEPGDLVADDYAATAPFNMIRVWGGDYFGCSMNDTEAFDVFIWNGNPSTGGVLVFSGSLTGATSLVGTTPWGPTNHYQIDIPLETTITQLNGWIGITRKGATCSEGFAWTVYSGGNVLQRLSNTWVVTSSNVLLCLGNVEGEPPASVPLSDWALALGMILMAGFLLVRLHRVA
jgi:uncharacterized membrane protein YgdD (TMEM256/DUF423 family)